MYTVRQALTYLVVLATVIGVCTFVWAVRSGPINHAAWESTCSQALQTNDSNWVVENRTGNGRLCYSTN